MRKVLIVTVLLMFTSIFIFAQEDKENKKEKLAKTINSTSSTITYDFTTGADKYYGGGAGAVELETGVWGMIAGDANGDGTVNAVDYNDHWLIQNGTTYDYSKTGDFNLDGTINAVDYNNFWLLNNGTATQVP